jgi:hypothetical protein
MPQSRPTRVAAHRTPRVAAAPAVARLAPERAPHGPADDDRVLFGTPVPAIIVCQSLAGDRGVIGADGLVRRSGPVALR